jgi:lipopolysaccharide transport system permease protein
MNQVLYSAQPALTRPGSFLHAALADLRRAAVISGPLFRRNLQIRHRRAWLGYLWLCLPMLVTTCVCLYLRAQRIVALPDTAIAYPLFVLCGVTLWQLFLDSINAPLQHLSANKQLITRSRVPHEALFLAALLEVLLNCVVRLAVLVPVLLWFGIEPDRTQLLVPLGILALAMLGFTFGLLLAPLGMLYDDVGRSLALLTSLWFFVTPVLYDTPNAGPMSLNPVAPLLDTTRAWLTAGPAAPGFLGVAAATAALLAITWLLYRLAQPHVIGRLG